SQYIFGHSLINHTLSNYGGNETSVPHWLSALSEAGGHTYSAAGRFGTVPQFANDEPFPQWGFDSVDSSWEEPTSFGDAGINNFLFTELNYTQWQGPLDNYYGDSTSPVGAAVSLISRLRQDYPSTPIYIYENWPDMWTFPLSQEQLSQYHNQTAGSWHEWWIEYHDYIRQQHSDVKMIPVGPVIAGLLQGPLSGIPQEDLYEDSAPHGTPTLYLLASMVTYSAIYREPIPSIALPGDISPEIGAQYNTIRNFIWNYLQAFTDSSGNSRVF
ncbi:MAG: hypothetical protein OIF34_12520, partial [Porticoccaceae bacterium]|nr:hypothetical protein [Porticoccaceae bacterium]